MIEYEYNIKKDNSWQKIQTSVMSVKMSHFYRYFWTCVCLSMVFEVASSVETDVRWLIWGAQGAQAAAEFTCFTTGNSAPRFAEWESSQASRDPFVHKERSHQDVDHTFIDLPQMAAWPLTRAQWHSSCHRRVVGVKRPPTSTFGPVLHHGRQEHWKIYISSKEALRLLKSLSWPIRILGAHIVYICV